MATKVKQVYRSTYAISTTTRNGEVSKVTIWQPKVANSTQRVEAPKRSRRKA
jgi:hypothetical protein